MKAFFQGVRMWWLRRFRGYVAAPQGAGGQGTSWQQHNREEVGFTCRCGQAIAFTLSDFYVRSRNHVEGCHGVEGFCSCPASDARFVAICPGCRLGHWKDALGASVLVQEKRKR